jgi:hypothetical protein
LMWTPEFRQASVRHAEASCPEWKVTVASRISFNCVTSLKWQIAGKFEWPIFLCAAPTDECGVHEKLELHKEMMGLQPMLGSSFLVVPWIPFPQNS